MAYTQRFEEGAAEHLGDGEQIILAVRASVSPTTMVMAVATFVAVFAAITINSGVTSIGMRLIGSGIAIVGILAFYFALNRWFGPRLGPYVVVGLSETRVLVFERDLIGRLRGRPVIADRDVVSATIRPRVLLMPHRLTLTGLTPEALTLDAPRIEPSQKLVDELGGTTVRP